MAVQKNLFGKKAEKCLFPSFAPPHKWRNPKQSQWLGGREWQRIRKNILERDNFTCAYCGYRSGKFQIADHIDGDPENHSERNLQVICQMCNLIKHAGQGCVIRGIVDLYKESAYTQNDIIRSTRRMRDEGKTDQEIIAFLGLKEKAPFKMERPYLRTLYGFVTARKPKAGNDMYGRWLEYHKKQR